MSAHDPALLVIERPRLLKDTVRNGHLPDVVQEGGAGNLRKRFQGKVHRLGHGHGERGYAFAVAHGFGVLQVQRSAQGLERCIIGLLELAEGVFQLARALPYQLLQISLVIAIFDQQAAMFQRSTHAEKKLVLLERFQDVIVGAAANRLECGGHVVHGRDHDHGELRIMRAQPRKQLQAIHFRHQHVAEDQVGGILLQVLNGQPTIPHCRARISLALEHGRDDLAYRLFVIHDKD